MNFWHSIRTDLVDKRLLPVVVVLAAVAVLVPVGAGLLSGSGSSQPVIGPPAVVTPPPGAPSPASALNAVAGPGTPSTKLYKGKELDPFRQRAAAAVATAANTTATKTSAVATTTAKTPATTTAKTTPVTSTPANTTPVKPNTTTPATTTPATPTPVVTPSPKAQLAVLRSRDSYAVDMKVADVSGTRSLSGVLRLSPLPSGTNPLVEYLGVLRSRRAVAFLVNPRTVVSGPGVCLPTPATCQVLLLKPGQLEALGAAGTNGGPSVLQASIAVSDWRVVTHSSAAAARRVRAQEAPQGRMLVSQSTQPALSDLVYTVAQGAVSVIPAVLNALPSVLTHLLGG
ncbi:MAG: hypothetical protein ACR2KV_15775 [Solirubrobacteraceae bacterium]